MNRRFILVLNLLILLVVPSSSSSIDGSYLPPPGRIVIKTPIATLRHVGFGAVVPRKNYDQSKYNLRTYGMNNPNFHYDLPPEHGGLSQPDRTKSAIDKSAEAFRNIPDDDHKYNFKSLKVVSKQRGLTSIGVRGPADSHRRDDGELYNVKFRRKDKGIQAKSKIFSVSGTSEKNMYLQNSGPAAQEISETRPADLYEQRPPGMPQAFAPVSPTLIHHHGLERTLHHQPSRTSLPPNYGDQDPHFSGPHEPKHSHVSSLIFDPPDVPSNIPDKLYQLKGSESGASRNYKDMQAFGGLIPNLGNPYKSLH